ncbi:hypothetical protein F4818DRAFT_342213 [Hypoxylon cercidicola]|nr:hypothetical protein F4818DRAFT_342213 [Hypoxylon cercidicola]
MCAQSPKSQSCLPCRLSLNIFEMELLLAGQNMTSTTSSSHEINEVSRGNSTDTACLTEYRIPGFLVNPENLVRVLRDKFNDNYKVKLRNDNYSISTPRRLTKRHSLITYLRTCHVNTPEFETPSPVQ